MKTVTILPWKFLASETKVYGRLLKVGTVFLDCFLEAVQNEVDKFKPPTYIHDNLSKGETQALFSLSSDDSIIIKPEDKGPAFVVQNKASYVESALSDLNNEKFYRKNDADLSPDVSDQVKSVFQKMLEEVDIYDQTAQYLLPKDCKTSRYYTLPKTHKERDELGHLKIRPVISGSGSPIWRLSEFVNFYGNPEVQKLDSIIKDSKYMVRLIAGLNEKGPLPPTTAMFTIDVKKMYPRMPQHLGVKGVRKAFSCFPKALHRKFNRLS
ncbi:hypothetical protein HOLleu_24287 [Holothuria leucospilota]|uniref:Reverse transcriptase domain-containing protein n=1 Tax=Holothuria leucospilota TaxID=206669 RepID=A0A9Q1BWG9_HOLLE|nr:hypothetical protein HOLleu_24287 [Holothuria leucospilota]